MKKRLLTFLFIVLISAGAVCLYIFGFDFLYNILGKTGKSDVDSNTDFSAITEESYVEDPVLGRFPGKKESNAGAIAFYAYGNNPEEASKLFEEYRFFLVEEVPITSSGNFVLSEDDVVSTHTFECDVERTFAQKNVNMEFISSGFDFMKAVRQGDQVFTKCKNQDCSILGPDCIIVRNVYE
jgi:hypothetical protein